jgi:hypothetical protein
MGAIRHPHETERGCRACGDFLMLDFGHNDGKGNMRGAAFTGGMPMILMTEYDGTEAYIPYFQNAINMHDASTTS